MEVTYKPKKHKATFKDLSFDIGDQPVTGIAFDPTAVGCAKAKSRAKVGGCGSSGDLYAATDFGVLRLAKGSKHWKKAASGLPAVAVYGITLNDSKHVLYAATHGRGAYRLKLG
jgi:hypothetical protein